jgi:hypothetical protein
MYLVRRTAKYTSLASKNEEIIRGKQILHIKEFTEQHRIYCRSSDRIAKRIFK